MAYTLKMKGVGLGIEASANDRREEWIVCTNLWFAAFYDRVLSTDKSRL